MSFSQSASRANQNADAVTGTFPVTEFHVKTKHDVPLIWLFVRLEVANATFYIQNITYMLMRRCVDAEDCNFF